MNDASNEGAGDERLEVLRGRLEFRGVTMKVPDSVRKEFRSFRGSEVAVDATGARSAIWLTPQEAEFFGVRDSADLVPPSD